MNRPKRQVNSNALVGGSVLDQVVSNNLCVGCGMCVGMLPRTLRIITDPYGAYCPELINASATPQWQETSLQVCPFADHDDNEDTIATKLYGLQPGIEYLTGVGYHLATYTGYVADESLRAMATSGGIATWLIKSLMEDGTVDAAVCVGRSTVSGTLFDFQVIDNPRDLDRCKKSRYYPVELSKVIPYIREARKKVVLVGLPCFIKAARLAAAIDPILRECVIYTVSIFCGHLKSRAFATYLANCCGIRDEEIVTADFRKAVSNRYAWDYDFEVTYRRGQAEERKSVRMKDVFGGNWSLNFFMLNACNYCDDVIGETADVSIGDAWLQPYARDSRGTNLLVCRRQKVVDRLQQGCKSGDLHLETMSAEIVLQSQAGAFRQRRSGLSYRLFLAQKKVTWYPIKRVEATPQQSAFVQSDDPRNSIADISKKP